MAARVNTLRSLSQGQHRLRILDDNQSLAFAAGIGYGFVLLSRGLLQRLTPRERRVVLAHEIAHLRHGDLPRNLVFEILLLPHTPWGARKLRSLWRQALEECADDRVAARYGAEDVAGTLLKVLRMSQAEEALVFTAAGADPLWRIRRLLSVNDELPGQSRGFQLGYLVFLMATAVTVTLSHHPLETLLGLVTGV